MCFSTKMEKFLFSCVRGTKTFFFRFHAGKFSSAAPILDCLRLSFETRILSFEMPNDLFIAYIYCHAPKSAPDIPASNSDTPMGADMRLFFK
jgi:hypothetical protein